MVHRVMQCCIVLPCVSMGVGVIMQKVYAPLADDKAMVRNPKPAIQLCFGSDFCWYLIVCSFLLKRLW
jgi:hypothetical protein